MEETIAMLKLFEKDCMDTYLEREAKNKDASLDNRLDNLEKK